MPNLFLYLVYVLALAIVMALLEIQIEGEHGWAGELPTWRIRQGLWPKILGHEVTGYHTYLNLWIMLFLHLPILFAGWSWSFELLIIGTYSILFVIEDFLWFVFNPAVGWKRYYQFAKKWHGHFWGPLPAFYYLNSVVGFFLIYLAYHIY